MSTQSREKGDKKGREVRKKDKVNKIFGSSISVSFEIKV